jgi:hypothetical protein
MCQKEKNGLMAFAELSRVGAALRAEEPPPWVNSSGERASCAKGVAGARPAATCAQSV